MNGPGPAASGPQSAFQGFTGANLAPVCPSSGLLKHPIIFYRLQKIYRFFYSAPNHNYVQTKTCCRIQRAQNWVAEAFLSKNRSLSLFSIFFSASHQIKIIKLHSLYEIEQIYILFFLNNRIIFFREKTMRNTRRPTRTNEN